MFHKGSRGTEDGLRLFAECRISEQPRGRFRRTQVGAPAQISDAMQSHNLDNCRGVATCPETVSLLVRDALPGGVSSTIQANQIANVSLSGSERFFILHQDFLASFNHLSFNSCSIVPGQALTIGGTLSGGTLTPADVSLGPQGFAGTAAGGLGSGGTFTFNAQGLAGVLLPSPVTVQTLQFAFFVTELENLTDLNSIAAGTQLHLSGLVLFNTSTNTTNILALRLDQPQD